MRLQRGVPVAGVDPELARALVRAFGRDWGTVDYVAHRVKMTPEAVRPLLGQLTEAGYLERREDPHHGPEWAPTMTGSALAMASFLRPMSRKKADELLAGVVERAAAYNADETKPLVIAEVAVFGSYLRPDVAELGDLDVAVKTDDRRTDVPRAHVAQEYARASGRSFGSFVDMLFWPQNEVVRLLRNRSGYINVHVEDITQYTDEWRVVFPR